MRASWLTKRHSQEGREIASMGCRWQGRIAVSANAGRFLLAIHLLAAHATPPPKQPSGQASGPPLRPDCSAPAFLAALLHAPAAASRFGRGALGILGGLYTHSPLRGGRHDESSMETPGPLLRSTRLRERATSEKEGAVSQRRGAAKRSGRNPEAKTRCRKGESAAQEELEATEQMACAIESPYYFGMGRMKKWRGHCTDADNLLAQLIVHYGLLDDSEKGTAQKGCPVKETIYLQFYDRECEEYIDLEESSWQDFINQVALCKCSPSAVSVLRNLTCTNTHSSPNKRTES